MASLTGTCAHMLSQEKAQRESTQRARPGRLGGDQLKKGARSSVLLFVTRSGNGKFRSLGSASATSCLAMQSGRRPGTVSDQNPTAVPGLLSRCRVCRSDCQQFHRQMPSLAMDSRPVYAANSAEVINAPTGQSAPLGSHRPAGVSRFSEHPTSPAEASVHPLHITVNTASVQTPAPPAVSRPSQLSRLSQRVTSRHELSRRVTRRRRGRITLSPAGDQSSVPSACLPARSSSDHQARSSSDHQENSAAARTPRAGGV